MIKESESSKLGDAPVVHPCIYQEDSSVSAWGCPRHPLLHRQHYQVPPLKLYFYSITSYVLCLERRFVFVFLFCLNKMDPSIHCVGERHAPL